MVYLLEDRARARTTVRRLNALALETKTAAARGIVLPTEREQALIALTNTSDRSNQIEALIAMSERMRKEHLAKLKPLARDEFNAFCEYVNPEEPPESKWHIFLTGELQAIETLGGNGRFVLNCPPGHAKPLDIETPILMGDGRWKRLGDVEVGDSVMTHQSRPRKVTAVHEQGTLDTLEITTRQGREIVTAPDHSFLMRAQRGGVLGAEVFRDAKGLYPGDVLSFPKVKNWVDRSGKSLAEFELAALFAAHGSRTYAKDRTKTRTYLNAFLICKDETRSASMRATLTALGIPHKHWLTQTDSLHFIRIETKSADALAADYGLNDNVRVRRVPAFVHRGGAAEVRKYIETYVDHKAEVLARYKLPRIKISFQSDKLARDFQGLLARFAVPSTLSYKTGRTALVLTHEELALYLRSFNYRGPHLDRLNRKLDSAPTPRTVPGDHVLAIVKHKPRPCRCLTVEQDHTFIANGVVVHNSTYASRQYIAWRLGRRPRDKIIGGGHSQRFVENEFSKKIRDLVQGPEYQAVFPEIIIDKDTSAKDQWAVITGGQYVAKGAGQAVHGFRANFICVDDPYPKIELAESPVVREKVKTWFFGDLGTRLLPGATIFVIMTRFHEDDLTASIMEANKILAPASRYRIVEAPAICYDPENDVIGRDLGEVLWDFYSLEYLAEKRDTQSYQRFSLIYQQDANATDDSSIASKFKIYDQAPHATPEALKDAERKNQRDAGGRVTVNKRDYYRRITLSVDTATKANERANYSVLQVWGETADKKHYLLDQVRGKWELPDLTRQINKLAAKHGVDSIIVEDKGNGTSYIQEQGKTDFQARKAPAPVIAIKVNANQSKEFRFEEVKPMIETGEVFLPKQADWLPLFIREVSQFPDGANDDQVDAMTQYLRWVKTKRRRGGTKKAVAGG